MHCNNLALFLDAIYTPDNYFNWADYGSYEHMKEMGFEPDA
jgi:hypothetical protein